MCVQLQTFFKHKSADTNVHSRPRIFLNCAGTLVITWKHFFSACYLDQFKMTWHNRTLAQIQTAYKILKTEHTSGFPTHKGTQQ